MNHIIRTAAFIVFVFITKIAHAGGGERDSLTRYAAPQTMGVIGATVEAPVDNPADNIFHINIQKPLTGTEQVYLVYELDGVADHASVSRSINDGLSAGGYLVKKRSGWARQQERIDARWLLTGDNVIRFTAPQESGYSYKIKNVTLEIRPASNESNVIISQPIEHAYYNGKGYIKGFIAGSKGRKAKVKVGGKEAWIWKGSFEAVIDKPAIAGATWATPVDVFYADGTTAQTTVLFTQASEADGIFEIAGGVMRAQKSLVKSTAGNLTVSKATISIPTGALSTNSLLSITTLRAIDVPALDGGMVNVTEGAAGYRFLPHGTKFLKNATLRIGYDEAKIPDGYTEKDIKTYYFDEQHHHWVPLQTDTVLVQGTAVRSKTRHFTDMINAIIKVPESPEVQAYNSTSMKGIKAANPTAGVNLINPPTANNTGAASLGYPINLPAGRGGMQPQLSVSYNSSGGNGWLGLGWNLTVPSIGIDTRWGVPRFDAAKETETYSFNGEQLSPVAHRGELVNRSTGNKQFYPRVEGSFNKIIRHGDKPSNYWWEVTDKGGTRHFYGGDGTAVDPTAILIDAEGNIAHWALREVLDLNGNFIRYHYTKQEDAGVVSGTVMGYQLYISKITYTGHNDTEGKYSVLFTRDRQLGEARRTDISITANLGFKQVTADLLRKIEVKFDGKPVRSYMLSYGAGAFNKTLLKTIAEYDAAGEFFNQHTLDYYNDVYQNGVLTPFKLVEEWKPETDNVHGKFVNPMQAFNDDASALSGTTSVDKSGGLSVNVGFNVKVWDKSMSVGGNFGYALSTSDGLLAMMDMDGDGLPDKVFIQNNRIVYRKNLGKINFGPVYEIQGAPGGFFKEKSKTVSGGVEGNSPAFGKFAFFLGAGSSKTTATTSTYITDVNGDQLPDIVSNGQVYFCYINKEGRPEFSLNSSATTSPIVQNGAIVNELVTIDPKEAEKAIDKSPLHDLVRMWRAPISGIVSISAPVKLLTPPLSEDEVVDGVRVAVQVKDTEIWNSTISAKDNSVHEPLGLKHISVQKGDQIYFRVQSVLNGTADRVLWTPEIFYEGQDTTYKDANNLPLYRFSQKEDFLVTAASELTAPIEGKLVLEGVFSKPRTTDTVRVEINRIREDASGTKSVTPIFSKVFAPEVTVLESIRLEEKVGKDERFSFRIFSHSAIDWPNITFNPHVYYTESYDPDYTTVTDANGNPLISFDPVAEKTILPHQLALVTPYISKDKALIITPALKMDQVPHSGVIIFTVKKRDSLLHKQLIQVVDGIVQTQQPLALTVLLSDTLFFDYHTTNPKLAAAITTAVTQVNNVNQASGLYTIYEEEKDLIFGPLYHGWGQFVYNGNRGRATAPIDQSILKLSDDLKNQKPITIDENTSAEELQQQGVYDPTKELFIMMVPIVKVVDDFTKVKEAFWMGYDEQTFAGKEVASASRLGDDDPAVSGVPGNNANAVSKISTMINETVSVGGKLGVISGGYTRSSANMKVVTDYMDMNGDRYPDIITDKKIQYTSARGGYSSLTISHGEEGNHLTKTNSNSFSASGSPVWGDSKILGNWGNPKKVMVSIGGSRNSANLNGNYGTGNSNTAYTWIDMNGDGLPDKVYEEGHKVSFNLGYKFAEVETWDFITIQRAKATSASAGIGLSIINGSLSAGVGFSRSDNEVVEAMQDINGDGLPDILLKGNPLQVRLNTGTGFGVVTNWTGVTNVSSSSSTSQSANISFTVGFPIPTAKMKITVTPSVSVGAGMSRELQRFADVDGDGNPDYLKSTKDDNLSVQRSTIGRTNLLKSITRPLGAIIVLDYQKLGNTYKMSNAVWALTSVKVFDGHKGDGQDTLMNTFVYENGYYDRSERESYGFDKVTTHTHNTADKNKIYATAIQTFHNRDFYRKGLLMTEIVQGADGKKYSEKENNYQLKDVVGEVKFPALAHAFQRFYEGEATAGKSTHTAYEYDNYGNIKNIADYGDEGTADDLYATIMYDYIYNIYIMSASKSMMITNNAGKILRKREVSINDRTGDVVQIRQYIDEKNKAIYDLEYDEYGNMKKLIEPGNQKGQRLEVRYQYDEIVHIYTTMISNSYGYNSEATYDYRFGSVLTSKDINGNEIVYKLDDLGRVDKIIGPYEKASGTGYTIQYEYHPEAQIPWALTSHYDPANPKNNLETATFADGLGRILQTKKDIALYAGEGVADKEQMVVSGKLLYDGLGRVEATYYPVTEVKGATGVFNTTIDVIAPATTTYDVLNRTKTITLPDGSISSTVYGFGNDRKNQKQFKCKIIDANGKVTEQFTDVKERVIAVKYNTDKSAVWTSFVYNAIGEQIETTDNQGYTTFSEYNQLGHRISRRHPDAGYSTYSYDAAGNLISLVTGNLQKDNTAIIYEYDFNRLIDIKYPLNPENNVHYTYGVADAPYNRAGRIIVQEDASGVQEFFYSPLGQIIKNIRTIVIPHHDSQTFVTEWTYDTWNRLTSMNYPDGEIISYTYNEGGLLRSMSGKKKVDRYNYVKQIGYDKFEQRVLLSNGNGTKTTYSYESDRRRLMNMVTKTAAGRSMMDNDYLYDKVNNILSFTNKAPLPASNLMGGAAHYTYEYDDLYRLSEATGSFQKSNEQQRYSLSMKYNSVGGITQKTQTHDKKGGSGWTAQKKTTYDLKYSYGTEQPHAPIHIGEQAYSYDANGNNNGWTHDISGQRRKMLWDEENRLRAVYDNGAIYHYVYDAAGERVLKGQSTGQTVFVNGENKGGSGGVGNYTVYVNPYIVLKSGGYTKHYYIESQRIVSKLGGGWDLKTHEPAGDTINYRSKEKQLLDGIVKNLKFLGTDGQMLTAGKSGKVPPGQLKGGAGATNNSTKEIFQYYYHPDHLGSTSYVTDASGEVYQHLEFMAFGETFVEEHSNLDRAPYLFNGKELDDETGLYYYGSRYYDPKTSIWQSVDPMADSYLGWTPYRYCFNNPLRYVDPTGKLEFENYEAYEKYAKENNLKVLSRTKIGSQGHWLTEDRENKSNVWDAANKYNIQNGNKNQYAAFAQVRDFYQWVEDQSKSLGHEVKWMRGAIGLVSRLAANLEGGSILVNDEVEKLLIDLNIGIQNGTLSYFNELLFGKYANSPLKNNAAKAWDIALVNFEQGQIAPPIYANASHTAIQFMQEMADAKFGTYYGLLGFGGGGLPHFNWFGAKVTDTQARIDIPLLMLYPDSYKPQWKGFNDKVNSAGTLNSRWSYIFKAYKVK